MMTLPTSSWCVWVFLGTWAGFTREVSLCVSLHLREEQAFASTALQVHVKVWILIPSGEWLILN